MQNWGLISRTKLPTKKLPSWCFCFTKIDATTNKIYVIPPKKFHQEFFLNKSDFHGVSLVERYHKPNLP